MRAVKVCMLMTLAIAQVGCAAKPFVLTVDAGPSNPAELSARLLSGKGAGAVPDRVCKTPCSIEIAPDSEYELWLRAPDYYPAQITHLTYKVVDAYTDATGSIIRRNRKPTLVVPMQRRPAPKESVPASN